ncbi:hypothetical protein JCM24511_07572 [Saitozyma sp. JCM 24511]|nr:hypothetical protein JCM24511_07572 [Saitozyma sp. JCM 24511]
MAREQIPIDPTLLAMSITYEEMEAKRQQMIASFKGVAAAMSQCVSLIEEYTRLAPPTAQSNVKPTFLPTGQVTFGNVDGTAAAPEGKKRRKKEKKIKDPNAPKRPPSAYILFQNEVRDEIREKNPGMAYKDVLSMIAEKWKELQPEQKKVYEDAYLDATSVYRIEEATYKGIAPPPPAGTIAPVTLQAAAAESSESDSDSDSDSSDDTPAVSTKKVVSTPASHKPVTTTAPLVTPSTADGKKEKKRKNKEDEAAVITAIDAGEKKKKKKAKD